MNHELLQNSSYNGYYKGMSLVSQFSILWTQFDKHRPGIVVSNDWYNTVTNQVLIAPITTQDKSFDGVAREYAHLYIPFLGFDAKCTAKDDNTLRMLYIDFSSIKARYRNDFRRRAYIGTMTDRRVREQIIEMMNNIMQPEFRSDCISLGYQSEHRIPVFDIPMILDDENEEKNVIERDDSEIVEIDNTSLDMNQLNVVNAEELIIDEPLPETEEIEEIEPDVAPPPIIQFGDSTIECALPITPKTFAVLCERIDMQAAKLTTLNLTYQTSFNCDMDSDIVTSIIYMLTTNPADNYLPGFDNAKYRRTFFNNLLMFAQSNDIIDAELTDFILRYCKRRGTKPPFIEVISDYTADDE